MENELKQLLICNKTDDEYNSTGNCTRPYSLEYSAFSFPLYGVASPALILLTVLTNCLVCVVLLGERMRSPTNEILVAMAISDTLTGLCPLPCFLYFYSFTPQTAYIPYSWCGIYFCLVDYLPTIFHTASIWLTVALAVQRYICVCHPCGSSLSCGLGTVRAVIAFIYVAAIVSQLTRFFEIRTMPFRTILPINTGGSSLGDESPEIVMQEMTLCIHEQSWLVVRYMDLYFSLYYGFRVIFIHFAPLLVLIIMNALLVCTIRESQARRRQLLQQNRKTESRRTAESSQRTRMLIVVVALFIVVELPLALVLIINIAENAFKQKFTDETAMRVSSLFLNFFTLLSYPINFFIYCAMSSQFRETFKRIFLCADRQVSGAQDRAGNTRPLLGKTSTTGKSHLQDTTKRLSPKLAKDAEREGGEEESDDVKSKYPDHVLLHVGLKMDKDCSETSMDKLTSITEHDSESKPVLEDGPSSNYASKEIGNMKNVGKTASLPFMELDDQKVEGGKCPRNVERSISEHL